MATFPISLQLLSTTKQYPATTAAPDTAPYSTLPCSLEMPSVADDAVTDLAINEAKWAWRVHQIHHRIESTHPWQLLHTVPHLPHTHTHNTTNTNTILTAMSSKWREGQGRVRHNNQSANREHKTENSSLQYESCCLSVSLPAAAHNNQPSNQFEASLICLLLHSWLQLMMNTQQSTKPWRSHDCKSAWLLGLISYSSSNNKYLAT